MSRKPEGMGVADSIGAIKWVIIGCAIVFGVLGILNIEYNTTISRTWEIAAGVVTALFCLGVWILLGWFEHTLRNLVKIEWNTRPRGVEWVTPESPVDAELRRPSTAGL